jgi:mitochondrial chaperone BCS1
LYVHTRLCLRFLLINYQLQYGAPGSGKTSIIHSLAGELDLDVYVISLSRARFDDSSLNALIAELPEKCIALMEDIDAAFHRSLNREPEPEPEPTAQPEGVDKRAPPPGANIPNAPNALPPPPSQITLSGLLNALDGVGAQEGRILFATTNKYSALDPALCRPGRMDLHIEFQLTSRYQAQELFRTFYLPNHDHNEEETESEKGSQDSGYSSTNVEGDLIDLDTVVERPKVPESQSLANGHSARHLDRREISDLASRFAQLIPERKISVASLQGYLMTYKTQPSDAVRNFSEWIEKELATRREKIKEAEKQEVGEKVDGAESTPVATGLDTSDIPHP